MGAAGRAALPLLGFLTSIGLFAGTRGLDDMARGDQLGPGFWPRLALAGLAVACAVKVIAELRRRPGNRGAARPEATPGPAPPEPDQAGPARRLAVAIALIMLYVLATPAIGYPLATAGFIVAFMRLGGGRSPWGLAASAVLGTVGLLYVFLKVVYLPLPKGAGPFEAMTVALYRALGIF